MAGCCKHAVPGQVRCARLPFLAVGSLQRNSKLRPARLISQWSSKGVMLEYQQSKPGELFARKDLISSSAVCAPVEMMSLHTLPSVADDDPGFPGWRSKDTLMRCLLGKGHFLFDVEWIASVLISHEFQDETGHRDGSLTWLLLHCPVSGPTVFALADLLAVLFMSVDWRHPFLLNMSLADPCLDELSCAWALSFESWISPHEAKVHLSAETTCIARNHNSLNLADTVARLIYLWPIDIPATVSLAIPMTLPWPYLEICSRYKTRSSNPVCHLPLS